MRPYRIFLLGLLCAALLVDAAGAQDAATLRARHAALREQLANSPFHRPLHLESSETSSVLKGEIYATIDHPFRKVGSAFQRRAHWCDILILHLNVKYCEASSTVADQLAVAVGRKHDQPLRDAYRVEFRYRVAAASADYLHVVLTAPSGPLGTSDYRIALEATPLDARRTFLHMSYSHGYGMAARIAMEGYLATLGRDKVGFSVVEQRADGKPVHIGGVRGAIERNTMRYYLALEAYLGALDRPPSEQLEQRLRDWHAATERYPQLRELARDEYLEMKRKEVERQRTGRKRDAG